MKERKLALTNHYGGLAVFLLVQLFPFYWMITTSLKTSNQSVRTPPMWVPETPTVAAFNRLFTEHDFGMYLWNSILVCGVAMMLTMVASTIAGYGFARWEFPGKGLMLGLLVMSAMLPLISVLGPTFRIIKDVGLLDTKLGLILVYVNGGIPLATWMLYTFLQSVPIELEEAAAVDGASRIRTFLQIVLPLSLPGLASTAMLTFISFWNEFIFPLVIALTPHAKTLTVGLAEIPGLKDVPLDVIAAGGVVTAVPAILLVVFFQRYLISGITAGAVK